MESLSQDLPKGAEAVRAGARTPGRDDDSSSFLSGIPYSDGGFSIREDIYPHLPEEDSPGLSLPSSGKINILCFSFQNAIVVCRRPLCWKSAPTTLWLPVNRRKQPRDGTTCPCCQRKAKGSPYRCLFTHEEATHGRLQALSSVPLSGPRVH